VTVNRIPMEMNGSMPFVANDGKLTEFKLAVPQSGYTWDLEYECDCGCLPEGLLVAADGAAGFVEAGEPLAGLFTWSGKGTAGEGSCGTENAGEGSCGTENAGEGSCGTEAAGEG